MSDYILSFQDAVNSMNEGLEVLCEGDNGPYRLNKDGILEHYIYGHGYVTACLNGKMCAKKWKVLEISRYI